MFNPFELTNGEYQSNCSSQYMTRTLPCLPPNREELTKMGLPFGVNIHPFHGEAPPRIIPQNGVVNRCEYCRAFINPFVQWQVPGSRFICNLCGHVNYLNKSPYQLYNIENHKELTHGCVDFVVPQNFIPRLIDDVHIVFLIDLNCPVMEYVVNCIAALTEGMKVAVIAYDDAIHLYKSTNTNICENVIMPMVDVDICESNSVFVEHTKLKQILELIKTIQPSNNNCLYEAISIASTLLKKTGGKIICVNSSPVTHGKGKYDVRDPIVEKRSIDLYKKMGFELNQSGITLDLHVVANKPIDLSQIIEVANRSGGVTTYNTLATLTDNNLANELQKSIRDITGFDGNFRIRHSSQLKVVSTYGHFLMKMSDVISYPVSSNDTSLTVRLTIDKNIVGPNVFVQASYLFTEPDNTRIIRVCTIAIPVVQEIEKCLPTDFAPVCGLMTQILMDQKPQMKLEDVQAALSQQTAKTFKTFLNFSQQVQMYSSNLPSQLGSFALYCCSISRLIEMKPSDFSVALREKILASKIVSVQQMLFPFLYDAYSLQQIPTDTSCVNNLLLCFNGEKWILSVGSQVNDPVVNEVLGEQISCVVGQERQLGGVFEGIRKMIGNASLIVCRQNSDVATKYLNNYLFAPYQFDAFIQSVNVKMNTL